MASLPTGSVDLILFLGQSNLAGRGVTSPRWPQTAPPALPEAGWEYRAVSAPGRLSPLEEPFGRWENRPGGIYDGEKKTGSLVTPFVNAYYTLTGTPVVGLSASKGGSSLLQWQPGGAFWQDLLSRWQSARDYLAQAGIPIRHQFAVWCQGETDGDEGSSEDAYQSKFRQLYDALAAQGMELCFLIQIGRYNGPKGYDYAPVRRAQEALAEELPHVVMVSREFETMQARGLMKDEFHYYQAAYNEVGTLAGARAGRYVNDMKFSPR